MMQHKLQPACVSNAALQHKMLSIADSSSSSSALWHRGVQQSISGRLSFLAAAEQLDEFHGHGHRRSWTATGHAVAIHNDRLVLVVHTRHGGFKVRVASRRTRRQQAVGVQHKSWRSTDGAVPLAVVFLLPEQRHHFFRVAKALCARYALQPSCNNIVKGTIQHRKIHHTTS